MANSILLTGGAGFIGSNFVELAIARGHSVVVLDALTYAGSTENLENIKGPGSVKLVEGKIQDQELVSKLLKEHQTDWLINFAAESHVDKSIAGPAPFIDTNIVGTFHLLSAAKNYFDSHRN
jgi:dTDP-glucose 4,6-dehydratase